MMKLQFYNDNGKTALVKVQSFSIVRRIGMTKPPVKLGVGKNS